MTDPLGVLRRPRCTGPSSALQLDGKVFGQRTVLARIYPNDSGSGTRWLVACECGRLDVVSGSTLTQRKTDCCRSCAAHDSVRSPEFVDDVVVDAIVVGHRMPGATRADRRAAAIRLLRTRRDMTIREIAESVGVAERTIYRARKTA